MLGASKMKIIEELVAGCNKEELIWLNGYLAGILANGKPVEDIAPAKSGVNKLTIAYGTETGNAKKLASEFVIRAKKTGIPAKLVSLDQYRLNDLPKEEYFLTIVSTQGEGDPPEAAKKFFDHIHNNGFKLDRLKFSVLALGDTSYPLFCKAGEDVDAQLQKLGGQRIVPLQKCDIDYESVAEDWFHQVLSQLGSSQITIPQPQLPVPAKKTGGKKLHKGTILTSINLNDRGSNKETYHIEIAAEDVDYLPGDSLGLVPENPSTVVASILDIIGIGENKEVSYRNEQLTAFELLKKKLAIIYLPERVVAKYAALVGQDIPATRIGLQDLLKIYPLKDAGQFDQLVELLEPITPRLYSISSSPEAHGGEVHLTVARDKFCVNEEWKFGHCSDYLSRLPIDERFEFYIHKNQQFRLPADDRDLIMIGPGTGLAPFRSFLAQRETTGAMGRNWLFFGDQHFVTDFLYQSEIQNWYELGVLTRIDVAFSRDQKEKIYVQHKIKKQGRELYQWLAGGAYVYVCGSKDPMSNDVEHALVQVVQEHGNRNEKAALEFINQLKEEGRYLKDVY
jgi:sulfite reductase (NADPH) flavoprotein alpha-component